MNKSIHSAISISLGVAAFTGTVPAAYAQSKSAGLEEVFVTARKRDEGVQTVPLAMTALSNEALQQRGVTDVMDLNLAVPGFRFTVSGGKGNNDAILRGLGRVPIGDGMPAVVTYFANVALPARGSNIPMYDIANVQVLKGPQGTLFGRNTLGGAVVISPTAPTYETSGYLKGSYGTKDDRVLEGAITLPIVDDKVALRVAGQVHRRDGYVKSLSGDDDFNDAHENSYRVSLLLNPTDNIENLTVYDHMTAIENSMGTYMFRINEGALAGLEAGFNADPQLGPFLPGTQLANQIRGYLAGNKAAGYHSHYSNNLDTYGHWRHLEGISNDTTIDLGWATVRNIFGWRSSKVLDTSNTGSTGPLQISVPPIPGVFPNGLAIPFTLFEASQKVDRVSWSNELQLYGTALDDKVDWITGYYWAKDEGGGPNGTRFTAFASAPGQTVSSHSDNKSYAVFAQGGLDLSDWTVEGLKLNLGARYSVDRISVCGGPGPEFASYMTAAECERVAASGKYGVGTDSNSNYEYSYTAGLDWQITYDTLIYFTTRRGYRAASVNTPVFNTAYTSGGALPPDPTLPGGGVAGTCLDPARAPAGCPDLRPFQKTDPEVITDYEIGIKNDWAIGDVKGRINVAAYTMEYKDAVQFLSFIGYPIPANYSLTGSSIGVNAADLTINGVEADLTVIPVPSLTLTLSASVTDQKVDDVSVPAIAGSRPYTEDSVTAQSPELSTSISAAWRLPFTPLDGDVVLSGDYYYTDDFAGYEGENLPGYELFNFRVSWSGIAKSGLDLSAFVKNAMDEEYFAASSVLLLQFPISSAIVGNPRTWGVEANYKF